MLYYATTSSYVMLLDYMIISGRKCVKKCRNTEAKNYAQGDNNHNNIIERMIVIGDKEKKKFLNMKFRDRGRKRQKKLGNRKC